MGLFYLGYDEIMLTTGACDSASGARRP
jgi:hypothetical protein